MYKFENENKNEDENVVLLYELQTRDPNYVYVIAGKSIEKLDPSNFMSIFNLVSLNYLDGSLIFNFKPEQFINSMVQDGNKIEFKYKDSTMGVVTFVNPTYAAHVFKQLKLQSEAGLIPVDLPDANIAAVLNRGIVGKLVIYVYDRGDFDHSGVYIIENMNDVKEMTDWIVASNARLSDKNIPHNFVQIDLTLKEALTKASQQDDFPLEDMITLGKNVHIYDMGKIRFPDNQPVYSRIDMEIETGSVETANYFRNLLFTSLRSN